MAEKKTINTRLVLRNADLSEWKESEVKLLKGEVALAKLENGNYKVRIGTDNTKSWNELSDKGQLIIPVENVENLVSLSTDFGTLKDVTLPLIVSTIEKNLSVIVEAQATAEEGYLSTYIVKQGGSDVGVKINIPKDKVIEKAEVVKFATDEEARAATGDPTAKAGTYLKLTIQNQSKPVYLAVPGLASIYEGFDGQIVKTSVNEKSRETYTISADIKDGTIPEAKLCSDFTTKIANVIAAQEADRAKIVILSGDDTVDGSVSKALKDAKTYSDSLSTALSTDYVQKDNVITSQIYDVSVALSTDYFKQISDEATTRQNVDLWISAQVSAAIANYLSAIKINDVAFDVTSYPHIAELSVDIISCGGAN